ncbi:MFS transporter [Sphingobium cupriresistens]|uniref:MFS transporter n=1 Tax=Sphingobium cupriresistens TaxID=1132417 RepID=A0A8G2DWW5_9SPHN|nr:MFS transporter [Sphingobium cupriresistens]RYM13873.1 MFS transporter [Sphingobium cupriresistens]
MASYSASGTVSVRPYVTVDNPATPISALASDSVWTARQILVVATCFILNMLDGMDVLILSYIAPALSSDWQVSPESLGVVFSAGLAGMAAGGLLIAPLADRFGRRKLILASLVMMAAAMFASGIATSIGELIASRFIVGIGIGTVLASMAALTAEYAPTKHRTFAVGFLQAGYPVGATLTGFVVASHLSEHGWQAMLLAAAALCAIAIPIVWLVLPESIAFLLSRQPKGALQKANRLLASIGQPQLDALPPQDVSETRHAGVRGLLTEGRARSTILLWLAITFSFMTLYFVISWIPKLAVEAGLPAKDAIYAGAIYNIGAFIGTSSIGLVAMHFDLRRLILVYMALAAVALTVFGSVAMPLAATLGTAFLIGVFVQGGFNGCYPLAASLYPPEARGTGIGWAMGVGRIGAVIGPMLGGVLLAAKVSLPVIFGIFAVPVVLAGICASLIRLPKAA